MIEDFPEERKQTVITRLAALNSALTFLGLTHGATPVTLDDWLTLADLIEQWAWRGLEHELPSQRPALPLPAVSPAVPSDALPPSVPTPNGGPAPAAVAAPPTPPAVPLPGLAMPDQERHKDTATANQIKAIFGIGKVKGYGTTDMKTWVKGQYQKAIDDLSVREASKLIERLTAL